MQNHSRKSPSGRRATPDHCTTGPSVGNTLLSVTLCPWASDRPMAARSEPAAGPSDLDAAVRRRQTDGYEAERSLDIRRG